MKNFTDIQENIFIDTPAAVNRKTGVLYINPSLFGKLTDASQNFVIAHEYGHLINNTSNEKAADDYALWRQIGLGEDSIDVLRSFYDAMPFKTKDQVERGEKLLRSVFSKEFNAGNPAAKGFLGIIEAKDEASAANGRFAKLAGKALTAVGGVVAMIPAVGQVIGGAISAGGVAIQAGGNIAEAKAAAASSYAQAKDMEAQAVEEANKELAYAAMSNAMTAELDAVKATNAANAYLAQKEKNEKTRKILIVVAVIIVAAVGFIIYKNE